jgi:sister chromatid cohesion protein DCC1
MGSIQASDGELQAIMKDRHILSLNGEMRTLSPRYLGEVLTLILNCVVANSLELSSASVKCISDDLRIMHDVVPEVTLQILNWYGDVDDLQGMWSCDRNAVVKEIGIGLLRPFVHDTISRNELLAKWRQSVGDTFEQHVDMLLLRVRALKFMCAEVPSIISRDIL